MFKSIFHFLVLALMSISTAYGQTQSAAVLPDLQALIDSALIHSKLLHQEQALWQAQQAVLSAEKNDWLGQLSLKSGVAYGTGGLNLTQDNVALPIVQTQSNYRYDVGVYVAISPSVLINRRHQLRRQEALLQYQAEKIAATEEEVVFEVTEKYRFLQSQLAVFQQYNSLVEQNLAVMLKASIQFENGEIDLMAYSELQLKSAKLLNEYEQARFALTMAKTSLENITGVALDLSHLALLTVSPNTIKPH